MQEEYYSIVDDNDNFADRWFLDDPLTQDGSTIDARHFVRGFKSSHGLRYDGPAPATLPIRVPGRPVAFLLAAMGMPVVSRQVGDIVESFARGDVQRFPVTVGEFQDRFEILNVVRAQDCIDETRMRYIQRYLPDEPFFRDRIGQIRDIGGIVIDPSRTNGAHIVRPSKWLIELVVSDTLRRALAEVPSLGIRFDPLTAEASEWS